MKRWRPMVEGNFPSSLDHGGKPATPSVRNRHAARGHAGEEGYILLAVIFLTVLVLLSLAVAAPKMAADIERDREVELVHRGQQYVRAIKLYYKKFGAYPPTLDALEKTNQIRFLRKRYKDPITGKDEWHLIHFGENKTPSYGLFGQPIGGAGGSTLAGVGPAGGTGLGSSGGLFSNNGSSGGSGSIFGSNTGGTGFGGTASSGSGTDPNAGSGGSSSGFGSSNNASPLTIGGLGIIGVESTSPKAAILEWHKKKKFNEWEFWYDPNADRMTLSNNTGAIGQPAGSSGIGGSSIGGSPGFGSPSGGQQNGNPQGNPPGNPQNNPPGGSQPQPQQ